MEKLRTGAALFEIGDLLALSLESADQRPIEDGIDPLVLGDEVVSLPGNVEGRIVGPLPELADGKIVFEQVLEILFLRLTLMHDRPPTATMASGLIR
jgi:hypothetical protein